MIVSWLKNKYKVNVKYIYFFVILVFFLIITFVKIITFYYINQI